MHRPYIVCRINSFGGIFFIIDQFRSSGLAALVDKILGIKGINTRYSYSNVIENLTSVFVSGAEVLAPKTLRKEIARIGKTVWKRNG